MLYETLGKYKESDYTIEFKKDVKAFAIPRIHEPTVNKRVNRLIKIGVLKKVNNYQWAAPNFMIPKINGTVRFISDFRELNNKIKRKPFPIPKVEDLLLKLECFRYATSLDLTLGY